MTNRTLRKNVRNVAALFVVYAIVGVVLYATSKDNWYPLRHDLLNVLIAIPAAYLAFCFQRRASYLQALRESELAAPQNTFDFTAAHMMLWFAFTMKLAT